MNLFPTLGSLQDVVDLGESKLPITSRNEMFSLLATYHNTLLKEILKPDYPRYSPEQVKQKLTSLKT